MKVDAKLNYLRIAPRKVRLVADLIREKKVEQALTLLDFAVKKGAEPVQELLKSAIANAEHNFGLRQSNLKISKILVNEGPTLKRQRARAFGRFFPINKRSSHVKVVLEEIEKTSPEQRRKVKQEIRGRVEPEKEQPQKEGKPEKKKQRRPSKESEKKGLGPRVKERTRRIFKRKSF